MQYRLDAGGKEIMVPFDRYSGIYLPPDWQDPPLPNQKSNFFLQLNENEKIRINVQLLFAAVTQETLYTR